MTTLSEFFRSRGLEQAAKRVAVIEHVTAPRVRRPTATFTKYRSSGGGGGSPATEVQPVVVEEAPATAQLPRDLLEKLRTQGAISPTPKQVIKKPQPRDEIKTFISQVQQANKQKESKPQIAEKIKTAVQAAHLSRTNKPLPGFEQTGLKAKDVLPGLLSKQFITSKDTTQDVVSNIMQRRAKEYSVAQFKKNYPNVALPKGEFDVVKVGVPTFDTSGQLTSGYELTYSKEAKRKINLAGSVSNYNKYLNIVRKNPQLVAIYNLSGGKGVGPLGIIPSMGVDLAMASNKPTITGASQREEVLISYLHRVKGAPEKGPTVEGMGRAIIESPYVQVAAGEAVAVVGAAGLRAAGRAAPRVFAKLSPSGQRAATKLIRATGKLGGKSGQTVAQRPIVRNFMAWAQEGARPAIKTTPRVLKSVEASTKLFKKGTTYIDDVGNVVVKATNEPIGYIDDFNRVILYKPKRSFGFAERTFISPERTKYYSDLLKKGIVDERTFVTRGNVGKNPWAELQVIAEKGGYKKGLTGVKHPYASRTMKARFSQYPQYIPDEALLTETEAAALFRKTGKIPGQKYGSLYNLQSPIDTTLAQTGKFPPGYLQKGVKLPGAVTAATKRTIPKGMKGIWSGSKGILADETAMASFFPQNIATIEQQTISKTLARGATQFGKGAGYGSLRRSFLIPVQRKGFLPLFATMGTRTFIEPQSEFYNLPKDKQKKIVREMRKEIERARSQSWMPTATARTQGEGAIVEPMTGQLPAQEQIRGQLPIYPQIPIAITDETPPMFRRRKPGTKKGSIAYPPVMPLIPLPKAGGRIASRTGRGPFNVRFYNEYEAVQEMLRNVIF